jgi:hypothetical protein
LVIGASSTLGMGVQENQRWSNNLEQSLNNYTVYNYAVDGFSLDQIYLLMKQSLKTISPDIIIIEFPPNIFPPEDSAGHLRSYIYGTAKPKFILKDGKSLLIKKPNPRFKKPISERIKEFIPNTFKDTKLINRLINNYQLLHDKYFLSITRPNALLIANQLLLLIKKEAKMAESKLIFIDHNSGLEKSFNEYGLNSILISDIMDRHKYRITKKRSYLNPMGHKVLAKGILHRLKTQGFIRDE